MNNIILLKVDPEITAHNNKKDKRHYHARFKHHILGSNEFVYLNSLSTQKRITIKHAYKTIKYLLWNFDQLYLSKLKK